MASSVLDTEVGKAMALAAMNQQADLGRLLYAGEPYAMMAERWPHYVHYRGRKPYYCAPDSFGLGFYRSPTDCDWIVPGTAE